MTDGLGTKLHRARCERQKPDSKKNRAAHVHQQIRNQPLSEAVEVARFCTLAKVSHDCLPNSRQAALNPCTKKPQARQDP